MKGRALSFVGVSFFLCASCLGGEIDAGEDTSVDPSGETLGNDRAALTGGGRVVDSSTVCKVVDGELRCEPLGNRSCGDVTCPLGTECCNASCGWCVPPGYSCIQIAC